MTGLFNWSTTAANNASVGSINYAEGQSFSSVNDSARELMADVAEWRDFLSGAKTTSGTDTITLTSGMSVTVYAAGQMFVAKLGGTNTGAATLNIDSVGAAAVEINGSAVTAGDLASGKYYLFVYDGTAFQATRLSPPAALTASDIGTSVLAPDGDGSNLTGITVNVGSGVDATLNLASNLVVHYVNATSVDVDADEIVLFNSAGNTLALKSINLTAAITTAGANGLDTGSEATSTWYYIHAIAEGTAISTGTTTSTTSNKLVDSAADFSTDGVKAGDVVKNTTDNTWTHVTAVDSGTTLSVADDIFASGEGYEVYAVAALLSTSRTAPTLPGDYTHWGLVGAVYNDSGDDFDTFFQRGKDVLSTLTAVVSNGTSTNYTSVSLAAVVPIGAKAVYCQAGIKTSSGGPNTVTTYLAPAGATTTATYGEVTIYAVVTTTEWNIGGRVDLPIETDQQIVYRATGTNASVNIFAGGWRW